MEVSEAGQSGTDARIHGGWSFSSSVSGEHHLDGRLNRQRGSHSPAKAPARGWLDPTRAQPGPFQLHHHPQARALAKPTPFSGRVTRLDGRLPFGRGGICGHLTAGPAGTSALLHRAHGWRHIAPPSKRCRLLSSTTLEISPVDSMLARLRRPTGQPEREPNRDGVLDVLEPQRPPRRCHKRNGH